MAAISRRLPQSNIARLTAIRSLKLAVDSLPPAAITLPPDVITSLPQALSEYTNVYDTIIPLEAALNEKIAIKNNALLRIKTFTVDFIKVLRITVDRSVLFADGQYAETDTDYYNLDETGGNLPNLRNEELIIQWANNMVNGEAARKAAKPGAPDMANPSAADINAATPPFTAALGQIVAATNLLTNARNKINTTNPDADRFILRAWDFLEANYSNLEDSAKRNILRQFGVTYVSNGTPNTITFLVKNTEGAALEGAKTVIGETGSETFANAEGRINIETQFLGNLNLLVSYPGKTTQTIPLTIPDTAEGQTFNLPDVVLV